MGWSVNRLADAHDGDNGTTRAKWATAVGSCFGAKSSVRPRTAGVVEYAQYCEVTTAHARTGTSHRNCARTGTVARRRTNTRPAQSNCSRRRVDNVITSRSLVVVVFSRPFLRADNYIVIMRCPMVAKTVFSAVNGNGTEVISWFSSCTKTGLCVPFHRR